MPPLAAGEDGLGYPTGEKEFVGEFLVPLLAEVGRSYDENASLSLSPALGQNQPGFDGLAKADFVGKESAFGKGGS